MKYPTLKKVEKADYKQLLEWWAELPPAGTDFLNKRNYKRKSEHEGKILREIYQRLKKHWESEDEISNY